MGRRLPQLDLQQDWMLTYFREENSVTTLRFYRQRDTNDSPNDIVIQVTKTAFVCHSINGFLNFFFQNNFFSPGLNCSKSDTIQ